MTTGGPESKEAISWRWAESDGTEHAATTDDLERLLRAGALPEYVLVWRTGWAEWLPAIEVAEFGEALGPRAQAPHEPKTDHVYWTAPDPPIARYAEFGHAAGVPLLQPGFAYSTPPLPVVPAPPSGERLGPVRVRDVLPTLVESPPSSRSSTLRPAGGAVPPPPRGLPQKTPLPRFEDVDRSSGAHDPAFADSPMPRHAPSTMPEGLAPRETTIALPKLALGAAIGVGLLLVALIVVFVAHLLGTEAREGRAVQTDPTASAAAAASAGRLGPRRCAVDVAPKRLAHRAFAGAPAMLESIPGSNRAAAGFAALKNRAVGLTVDAASLAVEQPFATDTAEPVLGVVPVTAGGALRFVVDQESARLAHSRTVNHDPPFSIGVSERGLSREMGGTLDVIWPGRSDDSRITPPRVASIAGVGHAVAFRHGEQGGKVLVGWLTEGGEKLTDLKAVATAEPILGTPSIADNGTHIVVGFAAKASAGAPWGLRLGIAPLRELPERAAVFDLPAGGPGKEAIAPSAVGLDPQRFLIQWTEGASGNRVVRAQIIDTHLVPEGDPITLSPLGENSGQGALWAHGDHAIALYYVKRGNEHELWGVSLICR